MENDIEFWPVRPTLRIDDISSRTNVNRLENFLNLFTAKYDNFDVLLAVSLGTIDSPENSETERVFPPILNAMSDHRVFFDLSNLVYPNWLPNLTRKFNCQLASHGLFHVDHRLLSKEAQEISIRSSSSVLRTKIFVPPFNKYNKETLDIVDSLEYRIAIWETGWRHLGYQNFEFSSGNYYFHMHDFDDGRLNSFFK